MFFLTKQNKIKHIEEKISLKITDDMVIQQYDTFSEYGEEHGSIKISVKSDVENIKGLVAVQYGKDYTNTEHIRLNRENRELWNEMQYNNIEAYYYKMVSGKKVKTIYIEVYIVSDEQNNNYLYVFY